MVENFITGIDEDGNRFGAFVTSNKPQCINGADHKWDGEVLYTFHNDPRTLKQSEMDALPEEEFKKLNVESGQITCSICGMGAMAYDNPYYSET